MHHSIEIEIDNDSGFCFGVVTAIRKAEEKLAEGEPIYCLGDIVHNSDEVERLRQKGLITITHDELASLHNAKVLLRAHGEPPTTYETARRNNIEIIDATCPVVLQLQKRIRQAYTTATAGTQIVIYGKNGHAEVNGLVGQTDGTAIVVEDTDGLDKLDFTRDILLYSQTTKSLEGLQTMTEDIARRKGAEVRFEAFDTICRQVSNRVGHLRKFASDHDLVLFVSGKKSSNGKVLFNECRSINPRTHLVSNDDEIDPDWLQNASRIGICGATSTPRWLMERVRDRIQSLIPDAQWTIS
ncbi:MAG: 4-hydroxy-3-methylbut-2-enyl diphosphate reductase [Muribaculaceae bacterium]|nr:4-hydroxy-3-methylbut-2-enyl diphosphate reductase [Muribaculaceae bacterium]